MAQLSVDRVVRVSVNLGAKASPRRNFGVLCIAGASPVITPLERIRTYTGIDAVAADFGQAAPEYKAAELFFSQSPRPYTLAIGRYVKTASPAMLIGGLVAEADKLVSAWTGIANGSFGVVVGGAGITVDALDFSNETNLNGVAQVISTALAADGVACTWQGDHFTLATTATGADAEIGFVVAASEGTDISSKLGLTESQALPLVPGFDAETPAECAAALADVSDWYGLAFADALSDEEHLAVAGFVEASAKSRVYFVTITSSQVLSATVTDDLASRLKALDRMRSLPLYSRNPHAAISAAGRAFTTNFNANKSTITLKFKELPGVVAEGLTEPQAKTMEAKHCNVFAAYDDDSAILQEGVMASGDYFDEIHGLDWLKNALQTEGYNRLRQSKTKVSQTDVGVTDLFTTITQVLDQAVKNGLIAPGTWNSDGFGQIERGDYLPSGYYVFAQPVDDQPQSEREQRKAPPIRVAAKLAGAIHSLDVAVDVNR